MTQRSVMYCWHCKNRTSFKEFVHTEAEQIENVEYDHDESGELIPTRHLKTTWHFLHCETCSAPSVLMVTEWCALHLDEDREECDEVSREIVYPTPNHAPAPTAEMPEDVAQDFKEAGAVLALSPRASAALLRLALQKLCVHLGQSGKDLNKDIGALVKKGLKPSIQQTLDIVRVIGNEAVHPGSLDLRDDQETALALFRLLNLIVEEMIAIPAQIDTLYKTLPKEKLTGIENRDHPKE